MNSDSSKKPKREASSTFEEAFTQLREIVTKLESGGLTLDEASELFEEGMQLAKSCNELLSAAELKITRLQRTFGEQMSLIDEASGSSHAEVPAQVTDEEGL